LSLIAILPIHFFCPLSFETLHQLDIPGLAWHTNNLLLGEMVEIIKIVIANDLPSAEGKSQGWIYPLITGD
jgi:hypothetical protein